jgi:RNA polymerase sigma factor (sigma-70 family)
MTDAQLLLDFREKKSHQAFSSLVARHIGWIHATARRRVNDEHLAHDVSQAVFLLLAERANQIREPDRLCAWLLQTTNFAANHAMREENRRRRRERIVAGGRSEIDASNADENLQQLAEVEKAVDKLDPADRTLIAVRFYQGRSLAELGNQLGISADAARKRVDRAIHRLRNQLGHEEQFATALAPLLAALSSTSAPGHVPVALINNSPASLRAISISKGVSHMLLRNKIRNVSSMVAIAIALGTGVLFAFESPEGNGPVPAVPPASRVMTTAAEHRSVESATGTIVISQDRTRLIGYSKLTGKWAEVTGKDFALDRVIAAGNILVYKADDQCYAFSATLGTWASVDLPPLLDATQKVGPAVSDTMAAIKVPGFIYAYTPKTGKWEPLNVTQAAQPEFTVSQDCVTAEADGKIYYCDSSTGKWTPGF